MTEELAVVRAERDDLAARLREAELDNNRLRHRLAATDATYDRPGSVVTPSGSDREGWLKTRLSGGVGAKARDAAWVILLDLPAEHHEGRRMRVVESLHALVDEIHRWKDAWSATTVDMDHKVRDAMRRSESCEHHGQEIRDLSARIIALDAQQERTERGRVAVLGLLFEIRTFVDTYRARSSMSLDGPSADAIVDQLDRVEKKVSAAHDRAWRPRTEKKASTA